MRAHGLAGLVVLAATMLACNRTAESDRDRAELLRTDKEWAAAVASRDVDKIVSYWTDDAIVLAPGAPALVGKQAIREFVAQSLQLPGFSIGWEANQAVVSAAGDMAYTVGTNRVTMPDANGTPVTTLGKAVTVWRKEPNGTWRCVVDIWNADPPKIGSSAGGGP